VPTGNVKFVYNGQTLGVASLQAGAASLAVASLPVGSDTVTAVYEGDTNYSSTSNAATVVVSVTTAPVVPADFVVNVPTGTLSITQGGNASLSFSLLANTSFNGTVVFTATNLPKGMAASFAPMSLALTPSGTATATLSISTMTSNAHVVLAGIFALPFVGSLFFMAGNRRRLRRALPMLAVSLGAFAGLALLSGCGGSSNGIASGDYTIVVQATPSVSGVTTKSFNVSVHVD
jgi:hypothetical protein